MRTLLTISGCPRTCRKTTPSELASTALRIRSTKLLLIVPCSFDLETLKHVHMCQAAGWHCAVPLEAHWSVLPPMLYTSAMSGLAVVDELRHRVAILNRFLPYIKEDCTVSTVWRLFKWRVGTAQLRIT
jgi:hypothetical protein